MGAGILKIPDVFHKLEFFNGQVYEFVNVNGGEKKAVGKAINLSCGGYVEAS